jgi:hypothetical protein
MKHIILKMQTILPVAGLTLLMVAMAFAQARKHEFKLLNQTGVEIHELYLSPHSSDDWEEDVLGRETLPDGESVQIKFDDRDKHEMWDLKIVDGKGASITWEKLDLTKIAELTIHYKTGKAWADVK